MRKIYITLPILFFISCNVFKPGNSVQRYSDFNLFWKDFRAAVLENDREKVLSMTKLPFADGYEIYDPENHLNSDTKEKFFLNYDRIFTPDVITSIRNNKIIKYDISMEDDPSGSVMGVDDFILDARDNNQGRIQDLYFSKVNGIYKLTGIPYYP